MGRYLKSKIGSLPIPMRVLGLCLALGDVQMCSTFETIWIEENVLRRCYSSEYEEHIFLPHFEGDDFY